MPTLYLPEHINCMVPFLAQGSSYGGLVLFSHFPKLQLVYLLSSPSLGQKPEMESPMFSMQDPN